MIARYLITMAFGLFIVVQAVQAESSDELKEAAFRAAQGVIVSASADAVAHMGMQDSHGAGEAHDLMRQRSDIINQLTVKRASDEHLFLLRQLDRVSAKLKNRYPALTELIRPQPLSSSQVQGLLLDDEVMLLVLPDHSGTFIFALTQTEFIWWHADITDEQVTDAVKVLRASLASQGRGGVRSDNTEFRYDVAYYLYQSIIKPAEKILQNKKVLLTATAGALQSLPLSVLRTRAKQVENSWLVDSIALITLPAISSLYSLRCLREKHLVSALKGCRGARRETQKALPKLTLAYVGIGAPEFSARQGKNKDGSNMSEKTTATKALEKDTLSFQWEQSGVLSSLSTVETLQRNKFFRRLSDLPGTEKEIMSIGSLFDASQTYSQFGGNATELLIKTDPKIAQGNILHLATHAVLQGEMGPLSEPGLVFTPPKTEYSALDDGVLTASEASMLQLSADIVVLSACNTAGLDGSLEADGLSGLARGFFYAGAKSLMVSHWSVEDQSTAELMINTFSLYRDKNTELVFSLQQAMRSIRDQYPHPRYWAPFVIVGGR